MTASSVSASAQEGAAKLPVDAMVLRPPPPSIIRFRRGLIIGLAGSAAAGLCGVTYYALRPSLPVLSAASAPISSPVRPGRAILDAPSSYEALPKLVVPADAGPPAPVAAPVPPSIPDQSRMRANDADHAARSSPVMVTLSHDAAPTPVDTPQVTTSAVAGPGNDATQQKVDFAFAAAKGAAVDPHRLTAPAGRWLLSAGSIISASLITGVDSDLPGEIAAQVTDRVYDSITGEKLLIPQGSRLIGRSDNRIGYGQSRVLIAWQRLLLPDGSSMDIDSLPAGDASGFVGLSDSVDHHDARLLKGVAFSSIIDIGSELSIGSGGGALARALRQSVQQSGSDVASQFASRNLDVQPTIRVRPGWPVTVVVREDLLLRPWGGR